jgi:hypothetical protein
MNHPTVWIGLELIGLREDPNQASDTTFDDDDPEYKRFPIDSLPEIPTVHPWQMYHSINDLVNMPSIFPIPSPTGAHVYIDPKLNVFFKTEDGHIVWALDEGNGTGTGGVYIYDPEADPTNPIGREYVASNLGDFLFRVAIENEIWESISNFAISTNENYEEKDQSIIVSSFALQYIKTLLRKRLKNE